MHGRISTYTLHQMCNYETLKSADDFPCCSRWKLLTNFQIQDKGACLCGNTTTHVHQNDLGKRQHGRFLSAMRQLMKDVLAVGFSDTAVLGTQPGDRQPEFKTSLVTIRRSTFVFLACMSMNRWIRQIKKDIGSDNRTSTDAEDAYRFDQSNQRR